MFVRTDRLLLRPGWIEDAPALARALGDEAIARNTAHIPWPYTVADAEASHGRRLRRA
jgi:RimJ/RimL family protein N-acetyltransferase